MSANVEDRQHEATALATLFPGDSDMARLMRALDWSASPLGEPQHWPPHLRASLSLCLTSRIPIVIYWGEDFRLLYNDAYISFLGPAKHPRMLGAPARECWREIWEQIGPMLEGVVRTREATWSEDLLMHFARRLPLEEVYVRFSFGPILRPDGAGVDGIFTPCTETTERVIGERRLDTLRRLGARSRDRSIEAVGRDAIDVLADNPRDVPFAALYLAADGERDARLVGGTGLGDATLLPERAALDGDDPGTALLAALPRPLFGAQPVQRTLALPVPGGARGEPAGLLLVGVSAALVLDLGYRGFFELIAGHVGAGVADAIAFEAERRRAEALAEIDRAKTSFFTNVSHEFRTPLALLLGPLEDLRGSIESDEQRELVATATRNARRLLKLVNALLDFARVEGGRADARFEPTDLAACTAELASTFRSACERAGLALRVDCPPLREPVFVDHDQWEKVVLNLLSNAFKFTFDGEIAVLLAPSADGTHAELTVRDSGVGIPAAELPKLFGRFQRVEGTRGRSFEGSGIGLALVSELVKLHGGTIDAASVEGRGTTFTVRLPFGSAHLPAERVRDARIHERAAASQATSFVGEALQWLPREPADDADSGFVALAPAGGSTAVGAPRILVADDNADLREYLKRLLGAQYRVQTVDDGPAAVEAALADPPDLLLSDVMMPGLDGFGVIARLRADARTRTVPVILLSARAGEESRVEGLAAGADDYLVKPFSARELLARVGAHLATARLRRAADAARGESEQLLRTALSAAGAASWSYDPAAGKAGWSPEAYELFGVDRSTPIGPTDRLPRLHPDDAAVVLALRDEQLASDGTLDLDYRVLHPRDGVRWHHARGRRQADGRVLGITIDVTESKRIAAALQGHELRLELAQQAGRLGAWEIDPVRGTIECTATHKALYGLPADVPVTVADLYALIHADDREHIRAAVEASVESRSEFSIEYRVLLPDGSMRWLAGRGRNVHDANGRAVRRLGITFDITERKVADAALHEERERLRAVVEQSLAGVALTRLDGRFVYANARYCEIVGRSLDQLLASRMLDITHPDDRAHNTRLFERLLGGEVPSFTIEKRYCKPDGSIVWVRNDVNLARDAAGRPVHVAAVVLDISERKAAETAAVEAAEQLRIAIATARLGQFRLELATGELECSAQCKANFGIEPDETLSYARLFELIHVEDRERVGDTVRRAIDSRTDYDAEYRTVWPRDGSVHVISARGRAVYADDGTPLRLVGVTQDVTATRRAERELSEQVSDLTVLHRLTAQLSADRELQPVLDELLRGALELTGAAKGILRLADSERDDLELAASAGFGDAYLSRARRVAKGVGASGGCYLRRERVVVEDTELDPLFEPYRETARIGGYRSAHATPLLARDGSVVGVLTLFAPLPGRPDERQMRLIDLLARHASGYIEHLRLLQMVRASEQRFRTMADTAPAMLWVSDRDNALTFMSRGWFEITGQADTDAYRDGIGWMEAVHPDDRDAAERAFSEAAQRREPFELEYRLRHADGSHRWALDAGRPRFDDDGAWLGYIGSVIDVHERTLARDALREADRRKDEFLATLAHELRNPLAPIRNALHLLTLAGSGVNAERVHEMLDRQVSHMVRLVDDLMEASRISRGKLELKREPLELADVLRTAVETSKPLIDRARHALHVALPDEPLPIDGDAVRLAQVFANLLNNAAKYTDDGGRIELGARRDGESALVSVRDNGIGIAADQMPRLFEMFAQLDRSHARAQGGLGIGLSLVQRLVQMHGGSVHASSEGPGRGSRFTVRLPLARASTAEARRPAASTQLNERRILVVDDNRDAADSLGMLLRFLGAEVRVEHDGAAAVATVGSWRPAVVLLDLGMPEMDGFEVARRLRADRDLQGLKLIALTGWGQEQDRQRTKAEGFDHHLIKPIDINVLHTLLATMQEERPVRPG